MPKTDVLQNENGRVKGFFEMISKAAMLPRPYTQKMKPKTVTLHLEPEKMELLNIISDRIGSTRAAVAKYIIDLAIYDAAEGCGFTLDEDCKISKSQLKWDTAPRTTGFSHIPANDED